MKIERALLKVTLREKNLNQYLLFSTMEELSERLGSYQGDKVHIEFVGIDWEGEETLALGDTTTTNVAQMDDLSVLLNGSKEVSDG